MFRRLGALTLPTLVLSSVAFDISALSTSAVAEELVYASHAAAASGIKLAVTKRPSTQQAGQEGGLAFQVIGASNYDIAEMTRDGETADPNQYAIDLELFQTSGIFQWAHTADDAGTYNLLLSGQTGEHSAQVKVSIKLASQTHAPQFKKPTNVSVKAGGKVIIPLIAKDIDKDGLTYSVSLEGSDELPEGAAVKDIKSKNDKKKQTSFVWTTQPGSAFGGDGKGTHSFTATVTDGTYTVSKSFRVKVKAVKDAKNKAPKITAVEKLGPVMVGEYVDLEVSAKDDGLPGNSQLTYSILENPAGCDAEFDENRLTFSANTPGKMAFKVKVSDGELSSTATLSVDVMDMPADNHAPQIDGLDGANVSGDRPYRIKVIEGETVNFSILASDEDESDVLSYEVVGPDSKKYQGAEVDSEAGLYSWTASEAGTYNLVAKVSDLTGATAIEKVIVVVGKPGAAPAPVTPALKLIGLAPSYTISEPAEFTARVTNANDYDSYTFALEGAPDCVSLEATEIDAVAISATAACLTGGNPGSAQFNVIVTSSNGLSSKKEAGFTFKTADSSQPKPPANHAPVFKQLPQGVKNTVRYTVAEIAALKAQGQQISFMHSEVRGTGAGLDDDGDVVTYTVSPVTPLPTNASYDSATRTFRWLPAATVATYKMKFRATDTGGKYDEMTFTIIVTK